MVSTVERPRCQISLCISLVTINHSYIFFVTMISFFIFGPLSNEHAYVSQLECLQNAMSKGASVVGVKKTKTKLLYLKIPFYENTLNSYCCFL